MGAGLGSLTGVKVTVGFPSTGERRVVFSRRGGQSSMAAPVHSRRHRSVTVWVSGKRTWLDEWRRE
jgi:hypothetical protein